MAFCGFSRVTQGSLWGSLRGQRGGDLRSKVVRGQETRAQQGYCCGRSPALWAGLQTERCGRSPDRATAFDRYGLTARTIAAAEGDLRSGMCAGSGDPRTTGCDVCGVRRPAHNGEEHGTRRIDLGSSSVNGGTTV